MFACRINSYVLLLFIGTCLINREAFGKNKEINYYPVSKEQPFKISGPVQKIPTTGTYLRNPIQPGENVSNNHNLRPVPTKKRNIATQNIPGWKEANLLFKPKKIGGHLRKPRVDFDAERPTPQMDYDVNVVDFKDRFNDNAPSPFRE